MIYLGRTTSCSTTARRGAIDWSSRFKDNLKPLFNELYDSVRDGTETQRSLDYNGQKVVPLLTRAGDAGLFVSDVWHRRMPTRDGEHGRFFLQVHYGRRDIAQRLLPTTEVNHLSPEAIARAQTDRERRVIGLHPMFFYDG